MDHFSPEDIYGELQYQMGYAVKRTLKPGSIPCRKFMQKIGNKNKPHQKQNQEILTLLETDEQYACVKNEPFPIAEFSSEQKLTKFSEFNHVNIKEEISEEEIELTQPENNAPSTSQIELQPTRNNMLSFEILEIVKDEPLTESEDSQMQTEINSSSNSLLTMNLEAQVRILESEVKALKEENEKLKMDSFYLSKKYEHEICNLKKEIAISEFKRRKIREKLQELILKCKMDTL